MLQISIIAARASVGITSIGETGVGVEEIAEVYKYIYF